MLYIDIFSDWFLTGVRMMDKPANQAYTLIERDVKQLT